MKESEWRNRKLERIFNATWHLLCVCVCWQKGLLFENVKHATRNIGFFHYSILVTGWDAKIFDPRWGVNHWKNDHHFFNNKSCRWTGWVVVTPPPEQLLKKMLNGLEWRIKIGDATTNAFFLFSYSVLLSTHFRLAHHPVRNRRVASFGVEVCDSCRIANTWTAR